MIKTSGGAITKEGKKVNQVFRRYSELHGGYIYIDLVNSCSSFGVDEEQSGNGMLYVGKREFFEKYHGEDSDIQQYTGLTVPDEKWFERMVFDGDKIALIRGKNEKKSGTVFWNEHRYGWFVRAKDGEEFQLECFVEVDRSFCATTNIRSILRVIDTGRGEVGEGRVIQ